MITYLIIAGLLFLSMLVYFKIADKYSIIDKPNHRSAHTEITLRGGGIIFPIAFIFYLGVQVLMKDYKITFDNALEPNFWIFGIGLIAICTISFIDDIIDLSSKIRLIFHFISVTLLLYFLNIFFLFPIWVVPIFYIMIIGILNAYNFMDGINGMSGMYTFVVLGSLLYVNENISKFIDTDFIIYPILACLVFMFFNFRTKAKCFLGDIGSMGIAFWILALLGLLMIKTGEIKWLLLLTVYGTETILTIIERLSLKENIFDAHRRHLYQLFANEKRISHLTISIFYAGVQVILNLVLIFSELSNLITISLIVFPTIIVYLLVKWKTKKDISLLKHSHK